jgi:hypothetical protein
MSGKLALLSSFFCLILIAAFGIGCGSSSSKKTVACTGTYTVVGDWQGTVSANGTTTDLIGVINSTGDAVFFDDEADIAALPSITGACSFTGADSLYASEESGASGTLSGTATGNVTSDTAINGTETANGTSGTFDFAAYSPLGSGSVTALSGSLLANVEGQVVDDLLLTFSGTRGSISYTGTDNQCTFAGTFTQESTNNVYDVTFNVSGSSCTTENLTGVGFEADSDLLGVYGDTPPTGTYFYAVVTATSAPFVLEVAPTGCRDCQVRRRKQSASNQIFGFARHLAR